MAIDLSRGATLALGGIGVRGVTNIGALMACDQLGLEVKGLRATGISTVIAAYYALGGDPQELIPRLKAFFEAHRRELWGLEAYGGFAPVRKLKAARSIAYFLRESLFCRANLRRMSVFPWDVVEGGLEELYGHATTEDLEVPLAVGVVEVDGGREGLLREGRLVEVVKAGIAFPGLFPPVMIQGKAYVASALFREVPLVGVHAGERPVIAFVGRRAAMPYRPRSILEVLARADELRTQVLTRVTLEEADLVITLPGLGRSGWASLRGIEGAVEEARRETVRALTHATVKRD